VEIAPPRVTLPPLGGVAPIHPRRRRSRHVHVQELAVRVHVWLECASASKAVGAVAAEKLIQTVNSPPVGYAFG